MGKHLVLVGGGHAHMVTLANLHQFIDKGHQVTVIGPSENHYYSGMGPGMLGKTLHAGRNPLCHPTRGRKKRGCLCTGQSGRCGSG